MLAPSGEHDHREPARRHAVLRAGERLGLLLYKADLLAIEIFVGSGGGETLKTAKDGTRLVKVTFRETPLCLVYDPTLSCAKTIMPMTFGSIERAEKKAREIAGL